MGKEKEERLQAASLLRKAKNKILENKFLIGFDGFVDSIIHVVDTRLSNSEFTRVKTIKDFGERIISAAGKSANIELVPQIEKIGGNGPLMANAVLGCGSKVTLVGLLGYPEIWPIFEPLAKECELISCGNPGTTDALEFNDGKLMLGKQNTLADLNWGRICEIIGEDKFISMLLEQNLVAITNWTELIELGGVIEKLIEKLPEKMEVTFFMDLADPEKRLTSEISEVVSQISRLSKKANVILGLNLREAEQISKVLNISDPVTDGVEGLKESSQRLREAVGLYGLVIHSVSFAGAAIGNESDAVKGPYCENPKITTGAGDHFNGGFCATLMGGMPLKHALLAGVSTSGWYVRNGGPSPKLEDTIDLLELWGSNKLDN